MPAISRPACRILLSICCLAACAAVQAASGTLRVGAAKVDVTDLSGMGQAPFKYQHQHANVRAIVIDNGTTRAVLVSTPGSRFDWPAVSRQISTELNIPASQIVISSTHSHSYMSMRSRIDIPLQPLSDAVLSAVRQAASRLQPTRMAFSRGESYLNVNRDALSPETHKWGQLSNLDAPSDKTVSVLSFFTPSGEPVAAYVIYSMHPVNAYALDTTTGDFPEAMSRHVELAFDDQPVVAFGLGFAGDQNPLYLRLSTNVMATRSGNDITGFEMDRETSEGPLRVTDANGKAVINTPADPETLDKLLRFIEVEGQVLGEEVIRVMSHVTPTDQARIAGFAAKPVCPARRRTNGDKLDPNTREGSVAIYEDAPPLGVPITLVAIGSVAVIAAGEEPYGTIGRKALAEAPLANTVFVSLANERAGTGYIPDDASYNHQTFQVINSALKPGCGERAIIDAVVDLETQYLTSR